MNRQIVSILSGIILLLLLFSGAAVAGAQNDKDPWSLSDLEEKTFYTRVNIFYEKPRRIHSTNYHKGKQVPAGSKVMITFAGGREIEFKDAAGEKYILVLVKKHSLEGMTLRAYFEQLFAEEDPFRQGGPYAGFNETERWNVKNGTIEKGMSRTAVLAAYGYPPSHETPSLEDDKWTYWMENSRKPVNVYFKDGNVYRIVTRGRMTSE